MTPKTITLQKLRCTRCDHSFWPRVSNDTDTPIIPEHCPKCNSQYWKKERTIPKKTTPKRK